jgi:hypothetical protein
MVVASLYSRRLHHHPNGATWCRSLALVVIMGQHDAKAVKGEAMGNGPAASNEMPKGRASTSCNCGRRGTRREGRCVYCMESTLEGRISMVLHDIANKAGAQFK